MRFKIVDVPGKPEYEIDTLKNNQTVAANLGDVLCYDTTTADGNAVTQPISANLCFFAGIAASDIPIGQEGPVVRRGWCQALVTNNTSVAVVVGDILIPVTATDYLVRSGAMSATAKCWVQAGEAVATATTPAAALHKVFVV